MNLIDRFVNEEIACQCSTVEEERFIINFAKGVGFRTYEPYSGKPLYFYNNSLIEMHFGRRETHEFSKIFNERYDG